MPTRNKSKEEFILNEPQVKVKNGKNRKSIRVSAKEFPIRSQREKINRLLIMHDLHTEPRDKLTEKDVSLLKQIAFEGTISNNIPALRYNAILKLASFPNPGTLNTLSYLAKHGEDHYIKSHALLALGQTGVELSIPIIAMSVADKNIVISNAAKKALARLINSSGVERILEFFKSENSSNYKTVKKIIDSLNKKKSKVRSQTKSMDDK